MKRICRILSFCLVGVTLAVLLVCIAITLNKSKHNKVIYAKTIEFSSTIGGFEMLIDNELFIDKDCVKITPGNCSFQPIFTIKKVGEDVETAIVGNRHSFDKVGTYILYSKVKSSDSYEIKDSISIKVVASTSDSTSMYINKLPLQTFYVDEIVDLALLAEVKAPNSSEVILSGSEHVSIQDGNVKATKDGVATLDIKVSYENISIMETVSFIIKPKIQDTGIDLILSINGNVLEQNTLEIEYSQFSFAINYELTNLEHNQNITCWTDSEIVTVVSCNAPIIVLKPLSIGTATIFVSPEAHPEVEFEIIITII